MSDSHEPSNTLERRRKPEILAASRIRQPARSAAYFPTVFDRKNHHSTNKVHPLEELPSPRPALPFLARLINPTEKCVANHILHFCPFPARAKSCPKPPAIKTLRPLL